MLNYEVFRNHVICIIGGGVEPPFYAYSEICKPKNVFLGIFTNTSYLKNGCEML